MTNQEIIAHINELMSMQEREAKSGTPKFTTKVGFYITKNLNALQIAYKDYAQTYEKIQKAHPLLPLDKQLSATEKKEIQEKNKKIEEEMLKEVLPLLPLDVGVVPVFKITFADLENCKNLTLEDHRALFFMTE